MDPFHVIRLAGDALDVCRRRVQVSLHGTRRRKHHPLYQARRTLHTGADLLTDKQQRRLGELLADDRHVEVEATWGVYQRMITAYRATSRAEGKQIMTSLIDAIGTAVPSSLVEVAELGRTLTKRRGDVLAFFDHTGSSNGPTESTHHVDGTVPGFLSLTHHIARSLLEAGELRPDPHPRTKNGPSLGGYGAVAMNTVLAASITALPQQLRKAITWDRGKELSAHATLALETGTKVYFADPHSPWQRTTNENTNGLLRQFFPKGTDLSRWTAEDLEAVAHTLNNRSRRSLIWKTPPEVFDEQLRSLQQAGVATTD